MKYPSPIKEVSRLFKKKNSIPSIKK